MKKQYREVDYTFGKKLLHIYHDGKWVETKEVWIDDFLDEIEKLEDEGYTYGYLSGEVEKEKRRYEHMLKNIIEMNNESWYDAKLSDMDVIRILENDDWTIDYDKERGMYRVSFFEDYHFVDEVWFNEYEEIE